MKNEPPESHGQAKADDLRPSADLLAFRPRGDVGGYNATSVGPLDGLDQIRKRSDVNWLGESVVPIDVLEELSLMLDSHPELRAMRVLDHEGNEITLWTGDLPNGYGEPLLRT